MYEKFAVLLLILLSFVILANTSVEAQRTILVPWGSVIRYKTLQSPHVSIYYEFREWDYDDSGWPLGGAPFGDIDSAFCLTPAATPWTLPDSSIAVRIWVNLPPGSDSLRVEVRYVRNVNWFVNGWDGERLHGNPTCPYWSTGDYLTFLRELGQVLDGDNLIVLFSTWDGRYRHFDCQVSAWLEPNGVISTPTSLIALKQNYPNPFNPTTTISFTLPKRMQTRLSIYNLEGKLVKTLIDDIYDGGYKHTTWDGTDLHENPVSSGVYFYHLKTGGKVLTRKMVLLK